MRSGQRRRARLAASVATLAAFALMSTGGMAKPTPGSASARAAPPNILLIVADDLGFSDLGITGGEIRTPTLDRLAREGVLLTQFNTMPTCSPSRAALLTGRDPHRVGLGAMAELTAPNQRGRPGYEGYLIDGVPTLAAALRDRGYSTYMTGKWHLGDTPGHLPVDRGFERSLAMLHGGASHMDLRGYMPQYPRAVYVEDGRPAQISEPLYSSDLFADRLLGYIRDGRSSGKPFFGLLAFTAPHAPLQAPDSLLAAQSDRYAAGWDRIRAERFERLRERHLVPREASLPARWSMVPAWDTLDAEQRAREQRRMAAYAAMVAGLDRSLAHLVEGLERDGLLANTVIVFMSDNGAEASDFSAAPGIGDWFRKNWDNATGNIGRSTSYVFPGAGWAQVSGTPNRLFKGLPTSGGTRVPAFVRAPGRYPAGARVDAFTSVLDIAPTLVALAGGSLRDVDGRSLDRVLSGRARDVRGQREGLGIELLGSQAYVEGRWKAVRLRAPWGNGEWQLYDLATDPAESQDLAARQPKVVARLAAQYAVWAQRVGVIDVPARFSPYPIVFGPSGAGETPAAPPTQRP